VESERDLSNVSIGNESVVDKVPKCGVWYEKDFDSRIPTCFDLSRLEPLLQSVELFSPFEAMDIQASDSVCGHSPTTRKTNMCEDFITGRSFVIKNFAADEDQQVIYFVIIWVVANESFHRHRMSTY
jgi:hypothetical protein